MYEDKHLFSLSGGDNYITQNEKDAFRVKSGVVLVYIVPLCDNYPGRKSFVYEASQGEVIPSFCYRDMEYCDWRFCFSALGEAELEIIEHGATKILKEKFAQKAEIKNFAIEGFNGGLMDKYRTNTVTEDGYIRRTLKDRETTSQNISSEIEKALRKAKIDTNIEKTGNAIYDCAALLCARNQIPIAPLERITAIYGEQFGVPEIAKTSGFICREVTLESSWQKNKLGDLIMLDDNGKPLLRLANRSLYDAESGTIKSQNSTKFGTKAYLIHRPLPARKLGLRDLFAFCRFSVRARDVVLLTIFSLLTDLVGIMFPTIAQRVYDEYIPLGATDILFPISVAVISIAAVNIVFSITQNLIHLKISQKISTDVQTALYDRLFNLPESFFRKNDSANLSKKILGAGSVINLFSSVIFSSISIAIYLIVFAVKMVSLSGKLTVICTVITLIYASIYIAINFAVIKRKKKTSELASSANSKMFQMLNGIEKIRIAGVEDKALLDYMKLYVKEQNLREKNNAISKSGKVEGIIASGIFIVILLIFTAKSDGLLSIGKFVAFITLYSGFTVCITQLADNAVRAKNKASALSGLLPILQEVPESGSNSELSGEITGEIEINNVKFAYSPDEPNVINELNLNIKPGEYVGIVGASGSGKSTLMKLLLGFEKPISGKIYYDNKDLDNINKRELRQKFGVILQDGKLISGSIYENIKITAPKASISDVKAIVKAVGLDEDIRKMPMGLNSILSEDSETISGGQRQKILIARAIISNPQIIFLDEATSALDNITQSMVCETLEKLNATRIVIAHRISTVIRCDRIIVMDAGRIVEQGNYDELMKLKGQFYRLASRQLT